MGNGTASNWAIIFSGMDVTGASVAGSTVVGAAGFGVSSGFLAAGAWGFSVGASSAARF